MHYIPRVLTFCLLMCAAIVPVNNHALAQVPEASASAILETRIATDADSCPTAVEVWLVSTRDTIQALELVISWDRPDVAHFITESVKRPVIDTLVSGKPSNAGGKKDSIIVKPLLSRSDGLLKNWEYVEARGESGLSVKVTAFPYLASEGDATPLTPSQTGLLISLPVKSLPKPPLDVLGDSASVGFGEKASFLSNPRGKLISNIVLRPRIWHAGRCWSVSK